MDDVAITTSLFLVLTHTFLNSSSQSRSAFPQPRPHPLSSSSLKINTTQIGGSCSFTVVIRTSCNSIGYTHDHISLAFGDAYGNQVYAPRLDDLVSRTFERCSTDTFQISGPCTYQICYLYLYRSGYDGWVPYDVTVYGYNTRATTFYYNVGIPSGVWYGFNFCYRTTSSSYAMK